MATDVLSCWFNDERKVVSGSSLATLKVGPGYWFIVAKVILQNKTRQFQGAVGKLIAGAESDTSYCRLFGIPLGGTTGTDNQELTFTLVHTAPSSFPVDLVVTLEPGVYVPADVTAVYLRITAIRVDSIANIHLPLPGHTPPTYGPPNISADAENESGS